MGTQQSLAIGWATTDITPNKPVQLAGQFHERISQFVHDPITATALALETQGEDGDRAILVSCDLVNIPEELLARLRGWLAGRLPGFDSRKLLLAATHTHTAPSPREAWYPSAKPGVLTPSEFSEFFVERVGAAVVRAWESRQPGGVSWALGHAVVGHNRRVVYEDGTAQMYGKTDTPAFRGLEGSEDHGVELLFTWDSANSLTGMLVNVPCPSQVVESKYYVSADYWSETRRVLREHYGKDLFILPFASAAGDQSPRDLVRRGRGEANLWDEPGLLEIAERLLEAIDEVYPAAKSALHRQVAFTHVVEDLALPARVVTEQEASQARAEYEALAAKVAPTDGSPDGGRMRRARGVIDRYERQGGDPRFPMELHVLRLGDVAFATNPFEMFLDFGFRIKARSLAAQTFLIQLCCGRGGYLATAKAVKGGGYSAVVASNEVGPEGGQVLVERTVELVNVLFA